ncbi:MAG: SH3 domain-containing protein [Bauldia sp.]|uniref:SH3 domain-containing protein n=1 Tax=Bauldia sp. TaxID=2575872 RepID=UPI001E11C896|nr:SH3 domain-containing protein [Bauldia sp.]MCB1496855.1 SH3 domain-containing protein [Bauldia sp.]
MLKLVAGLAFAVMLTTVAQGAVAAPGVAKGSVNLRTGPSTKYARITTIPAGARVNVLRCGRWCEVIYAGRRGWASASYIRRGNARPAYDWTNCYAVNAWNNPYCEWPIERSVREFSQGARDFRNRQSGGRKR